MILQKFRAGQTVQQRKIYNEMNHGLLKLILFEKLLIMIDPVMNHVTMCPSPLDHPVMLY